MSWSSPPQRRLFAAAALVAILALPACTVRPLYADLPSTDGTRTSATARVASIGIDAPRTRPEQNVYNHMIFLLNGGAGQPAEPRYTLSLNVLAQQVSGASIQRVIGAPNERQPTAAATILTSRYVLKDAKSGEVVARGNRQFSSSYDVPRQEFASLRARRDAEDRAARELAELVRVAVLQDLERVGRQ